MFDIDLQLFAEEPQEVAEEQKEDIPEELEGLPEDIAREAMEEAKQMAEAETEAEEEPQEEPQEQKDEPEKGQSIPFPRFQQKVQQSKELKARNNYLEEQLKAYQQKFGDLNAKPEEPMANPAPNAQKTAQGVQNMQPQIPEIHLTPDIMKQISDYTKAQALQMSGLTKEDVDSIEFMEDDDDRKTRYNYALKLAESDVFNRIRQARQAQIDNARAFVQQHKASIASFNEFSQKEMAEPDYKEVMEYARDAYFSQLPVNEQPVIRDAYARILNSTASPQDTMLIKAFYTQAKAAYHSGNHAPAENANPMQKVNEAKKFPRSQQVNGTGDFDGMSLASMEKLLDTTKNFEDIPDNIKKVLLGD